MKYEKLNREDFISEIDQREKIVPLSELEIILENYISHINAKTGIERLRELETQKGKLINTNYLEISNKEFSSSYDYRLSFNDGVEMWYLHVGHKANKDFKFSRSRDSRIDGILFIPSLKISARYRVKLIDLKK